MPNEWNVNNYVTLIIAEVNVSFKQYNRVFQHLIPSPVSDESREKWATPGSTKRIHSSLIFVEKLEPADPEADC
jgi:hypothetical protein